VVTAAAAASDVAAMPLSGTCLCNGGAPASTAKPAMSSAQLLHREPDASAHADLAKQRRD
jgi:hypothetical protein